MEEFIKYLIQFMQAISIPMGMVIAITGWRKGNTKDNDSRTVMLTEMRKDIDYIKKSIECFQPQASALVKLEESCKAAHRRMDEHLAMYHKEDKHEH